MSVVISDSIHIPVIGISCLFIEGDIRRIHSRIGFYILSLISFHYRHFIFRNEIILSLSEVEQKLSVCHPRIILLRFSVNSYFLSLVFILGKSVPLIKRLNSGQLTILVFGILCSAVVICRVKDKLIILNRQCSSCQLISVCMYHLILPILKAAHELRSELCDNTALLLPVDIEQIILYLFECRINSIIKVVGVPFPELPGHLDPVPHFRYLNISGLNLIFAQPR